MNETYGQSTSEGISQDNSVSNFDPDLSRVMQSQLITAICQCKSRNLIPT